MSTDAVSDAATTPGAVRSGSSNARGQGGAGRRQRLTDALVVGLPALLAAALCLYDITTRSLWLDEAASVAIASQHGAALGSALAHDGGNMLGYYALLHVLIGAFGSGAFAIRLASAIAAAGTVAIVGLIGLRLFARRVALAACSLTAVSLSLVYWGQDARGYALMIALIAGSFLALLALLEGRAGWRAWIAYVLLTTAAVYAGLEAVLVVPAQLVVLLWYRDRLRPVLWAVAVEALCCIPLAVLAANRGSGQLFWVPRPSFRIAKQVLQALTSSSLQPRFYTSSATALLLLTVLVAGAGAWKFGRLLRADPRRTAWGPALVISWLLVPVLLALIESAVGQSIFQARYVLVSLPAVALLLAWTLVDRQVPRVLTLATLAALIVLRTLQLAPAYGVSPESWRAAASYVRSQTQAGDCAAFYPLDARMPFQYYLGTSDAALTPILPPAPWARVRPYVEQYASLSRSRLSQLPSRCRRVWLVSSHEGRVGGPPVSQGNHARFLQLRAGLRAEYARSRRTAFAYSGAIGVELFSR
jgi:4-amino-4-deoxy-L-arabinose transferase-like glycosyltransferase